MKSVYVPKRPVNLKGHGSASRALFRDLDPRREPVGLLGTHPGVGRLVPGQVRFDFQVEWSRAPAQGFAEALNQFHFRIGEVFVN